ncbi:hypothetical protein DFJ73DRAFT_922523 [Zopfochytrium polystomum]|nr:hypothetical protein DFJ73DRAFT_922523 [Zopfochytrium polystomum]
MPNAIQYYVKECDPDQVCSRDGSPLLFDGQPLLPMLELDELEYEAWNEPKPSFGGKQYFKLDVLCRMLPKKDPTFRKCDRLLDSKELISVYITSGPVRVGPFNAATQAGIRELLLDQYKTSFLTAMLTGGEEVTRLAIELAAFVHTSADVAASVFGIIPYVRSVAFANRSREELEWDWKAKLQQGCTLQWSLQSGFMFLQSPGTAGTLLILFEVQAFQAAENQMQNCLDAVLRILRAIQKRISELAEPAVKPTDPERTAMIVAAAKKLESETPSHIFMVAAVDEMTIGKTVPVTFSLRTGRFQTTVKWFVKDNLCQREKSMRCLLRGMMSHLKYLRLKYNSFDLDAGWRNVLGFVTTLGQRLLQRQSQLIGALAEEEKRFQKTRQNVERSLLARRKTNTLAEATPGQAKTLNVRAHRIHHLRKLLELSKLGILGASVELSMAPFLEEAEREAAPTCTSYYKSFLEKDLLLQFGSLKRKRDYDIQSREISNERQKRAKAQFLEIVANIDQNDVDMFGEIAGMPKVDDVDDELELDLLDEVTGPTDSQIGMSSGTVPIANLSNRHPGRITSEYPEEWRGFSIKKPNLKPLLNSAGLDSLFEEAHSETNEFAGRVLAKVALSEQEFVDNTTFFKELSSDTKLANELHHHAVFGAVTDARQALQTAVSKSCQCESSVKESSLLVKKCLKEVELAVYGKKTAAKKAATEASRTHRTLLKQQQELEGTIALLQKAENEKLSKVVAISGESAELARQKIAIHRQAAAVSQRYHYEKEREEAFKEIVEELDGTGVQLESLHANLCRIWHLVDYKLLYRRLKSEDFSNRINASLVNELKVDFLDLAATKIEVKHFPGRDLRKDLHIPAKNRFDPRYATFNLQTSCAEIFGWRWLCRPESTGLERSNQSRQFSTS